MQPSPSSSLQASSSRAVPTTTTTLPVWLCRLIVGGTFVLSGIAKSIDLWGFIFKIEQYLSVWQMAVPRGVVFTMAVALASVEFLLGFLLLTGSYKRSCVWAIGLIMAAMLPLSLYIALLDPVPDCGCFGDMLVISNYATLAKNVVLTLLIVYLIIHNPAVAGLFMPINQWLVALIATVYIVAIAIFGYNVQPLVDFRPYPVGTPLGSYAHESDCDYGDDLPDYAFIYEKDGERHSFSADSLPDDSWVFVERVEMPTDAGSDARVQSSVDNMITIYALDGTEATAEAIAADGEQIMLFIPEFEGVDVSSTYLINEVYRLVTSHGGSMSAVIATNAEGVEMWRDLSMASYPIFTADGTAIKEIVRGSVALVYLRDGVIQWKRTLNSIDTEVFEQPDADTLPSLAFSGTTIMLTATLFMLGLQLLLWILDRSGRAVKLHFMRTNQKKLSKFAHGKKPTPPANRSNITQ